ncbi:CDP-alcohol phosphatidyltransferase family protein [Thermorudis peleae]|uniref:CDP-alcohol phosphatidyltransferase family protein n=1 Tax=Thermorudis peleae TaxID=1382356 RepID=UPI000570C592|nr:CDP-alcohol phosphatidyltransferase family protein [Thermorudis peleae]
MISDLLADRVRAHLQHVGAVLARGRLTPNMLTVLGFLLNLAVAVVLALGHLQAAGLLALFAGAFDMLDGAVARATGKITLFGGFLDSFIDRYSEAVVFGGILIYFLRVPHGDLPIVLCYAAIVGSLMVSYARARAEAAGIALTAGIFARPERIVTLALFLLLNRPIWALWLLAIVANITALQRAYLVWREAHRAGPRQLS